MPEEVLEVAEALAEDHQEEVLVVALAADSAVADSVVEVLLVDGDLEIHFIF